MTTVSQPTLSYHAQHFQLRIEITRAQALTSPLPSPETVKRVRSKMESVLAEGKIAFFDVHEQKLNEIWKKLHSNKNLNEAFKISFTLAAGVPNLPGLAVEKGSGDKAAVLVSLTPSAQTRLWPKEWIRATIVRKTKDLGIADALFMAQVQACINKIVMGEPLVKYSIALLKAFPFGDLGTKAFALLSNKAKGEIAAVINDLDAFKDIKTVEGLNGAIIQSVEKLKQASPGQYRYYKQDVFDCILKAMKGPESLGIGMPVVILAVMGAHTSGLPQGAAAPVSGAQPVAGHPSVTRITSAQPVAGHPSVTRITSAQEVPAYLGFIVSQDRMKATIAAFSADLFANPKIKFDRAWLEAQMKLKGIVFGLTDALWAKIEEAWNARTTLDDLTAAEGMPPVPGQNPYLHHSYKDSPVTATGQVVNIREAQQRTLVQAGQLVAEVRFKTPAVKGKTVLGQVLSSPILDVKIKVGNGIVQKEVGKFFATTDGLPVIDAESISVGKVFVHNGDVDLKSGNIRFDGPVEIKGSIDSGATVDVKGPLIVHGMIRGGFVYSQEGIEVKQGVVTTSMGLVKCKGSLVADFIENSQIFCGGSLTVKKALLNSQAYVARSIVVTDDEGIAGGGLISCRDALVANNIGFPSGARTKLVLGIEVKTLHRVTLRTARVQKLKEADERYRLELRKISGKRDAQMTKKHRDLKEYLIKMQSKIKTVQERAEAHLISAQNRISYNTSAVMVAYKRLSSNCEIEIAGQTVIMQTEMLATAVTAKKRRDTHFCTAEEVKSEVERTLTEIATAGSSPKKAG